MTHHGATRLQVTLPPPQIWHTSGSRWNPQPFTMPVLGDYGLGCQLTSHLMVMPFLTLMAAMFMSILTLKKGYHPDWKSPHLIILNETKSEVSAKQCIFLDGSFHADSLRVDAVAPQCYISTTVAKKVSGIKPVWGNEYLAAISFIKTSMKPFIATSKASHNCRGKYFFAGVTHPIHSGGHFGMKMDDGLDARYTRLL